MGVEPLGDACHQFSSSSWNRQVEIYCQRKDKQDQVGPENRKIVATISLSSQVGRSANRSKQQAADHKKNDHSQAPILRVRFETFGESSDCLGCKVFGDWGMALLLIFRVRVIHILFVLQTGLHANPRSTGSRMQSQISAN